MTEVEFLEHHQSLYKKYEVGAGVEDNESHSTSKIAEALLVFVRKR